MTNRVSEKHPFNDKQSQIAERKTAGEQGPGDHGKEAAEQKCVCVTDTFNDKQSQTAERKTGDGRGPGDHSSEAG
jgi:hypothetical protein